MSDNIFADIYNKILSLFGQNVKDESKNTAVNRLRLVLMQDRTNLTPEIMNRMRSELIAVLSKYVELDKEALDLNIGQEGEQMALMLSIPVIRAKDEAEIEQALKEEEEAKKAKEETDSEDENSEDEDTDTKEETDDDSESAQETEIVEQSDDDKETSDGEEYTETCAPAPEETSEDDKQATEEKPAKSSRRKKNEDSEQEEE